MKTLVSAFVYYGEDAGSTHTIEVWRHIAKDKNTKILLPKIKKSDLGKLFSKLEPESVVFCPLTQRRGEGLFRAMKFGISTVLFDFYTLIFTLFWKPDKVYIRVRYLSFAPLFLKLIRKPYICELNGLAQYGANKLKRNVVISLSMWLHLLLERYALKNSEKIICVTKGLIRILKEEYNIAPSKCFLVPNGVDTAIFKPNYNSNKIIKKKKGEILFGFVGHFAPWQGVQNFIPALKEFVHRYNIKLVLVGDGMMYESWKDICKRHLPPESYMFTGHVEYKEVPKYINTFDVCVAPFTIERNANIGLSPLKLYEYFSCAKPVLTTPIEGVAELVELEGLGVVAKSDSVEDLKKALEGILEQKEGWPQMGLKARKVVESGFTWQINAESIRKILIQ